MYLDKLEMGDLLTRYQDLSENVDEKWLTKYKRVPRRKMTDKEYDEWKIDRDDFKKYRYAHYKEKRLRFSKETTEETTTRLKEVEIIKAAIARDFLKIIDGVILLNEFQNWSDSASRNDMKSEATWKMYTYIDRYDVRKTNPFSYFTQIAKNAFRHIRDEVQLRDQRYPSLDKMLIDNNNTSLGDIMQ